MNIFTIVLHPYFTASVPFFICFIDLVYVHACHIGIRLWVLIHTTFDEFFSFFSPFWSQDDFCRVLCCFQFFFSIFNSFIRVFDKTFFCCFISFFVSFVLMFLTVLSFTRFIIFFCFFKLCFCVAFGLVFDTHIFISVIFFLLSLFFSCRVKVVRCVFQLFISLFDPCTSLFELFFSAFGFVRLFSNLVGLFFGISILVCFSFFFGIYIFCFLLDVFRCSVFCLFKFFFKSIFFSFFSVFVFLRFIKRIFGLTGVFCFLVSIFSAIYSAFFRIR